MLEDEPELFNQDFIKEHLFMTDTDRRIVAGEEADNAYDGQEEDDDYDDLVEAKYDEVYEALADPIKYFVDDSGMYTVEELIKASFISIDEEAAAKAAVSVDGAGHFLNTYDGEEWELPSMYVAIKV